MNSNQLLEHGKYRKVQGFLAAAVPVAGFIAAMLAAGNLAGGNATA